MSVSFFFPGQGSQSLGMMNGFNANHTVKAVFDEASAILGDDLWAMAEGSDEARINETVNTQPLMLTAGVAVYHAYIVAGGKPPALAAGHSLGEYTALVAADSLDFADAVKLVRLRAELMQNAVPQGEGAMAAILGLSDDDVRRVCTQAAHNGVVEAVNFNAPGQVVVAGSAAAVAYAVNLAKENGAKRALPLPVSVPSHCSLMKPAAEKLAIALTDINIKPPKIGVIHNVDVKTHNGAAEIKDALVRQLYNPVRWTETVNMLTDRGISRTAECGPGKVLASLAKRINKELPCAALTDDAQITAFIQSAA